ncbi:MAG TPA: phosphoribosylamine--glycine ligase [Candidatus Aminicenantes bacterium]|nr:phosphoribosylamine--glycine ligase [Candidatus Aminicenantes bacterium]HRY64282.1 phosphoribosylamine--glycine ligase [Candidatus Aminicenantes bacterium]HRZ71195.1 phosphoribosylamine--glycine ligase [Candidatus Aminicenantes bacterium]
MKVLVVGSGGREHALAWRIAKSPRVEKVYCAPGNGGTRLVAENVPLAETDIAGLGDFVEREKVGLTVVGPEVPLAMGLVDEFERRGLRVFGPSKKAAEIEGSKVFAKEFMARHRIPTGRFRVADDLDQARKVLASGEFGFPVVLKADGLAAGKGVVVCPTLQKAEEAAGEMLVRKKFGTAGRRVVIEEFLCGREVSFIVITDGLRVQPLVTAMDHKAAYDGDRGPNTGGMGAISPSPLMTEKLFEEIMSTVITPAVTRLLEEGRKFKGVLYAGLMITDEGPKVLEFNGRFGDPETQPQMVRIESDLVDLLEAAVDEDILRTEVRWSAKPAGCVVVASGGYPMSYEKGKIISGLVEAGEIPGVTVFHAGTRYENGRYATSGGRVLDVCASDETLAGAMERIYDACRRVYFEAMYYRRDIGTVREERT